MPIYDYRCSKCHGRFEKLVKLAQFNRQQICPKCGYAAEKLVTAPTVWTNSWDWPANVDTGKIQKAAYKELAKLDGAVR